jgi:hypothetical protein
MDDQDHKHRGVRRYPVSAHRECPMGIITFKRLEWMDHDAQIVDISIVGIGIESSQQIEPGLVWFKERIGGYKSGVLMWSKQSGSRFRAGIKFVPLSRDEEAYVHEQVKQSHPSKPIHDPARIISTLLESVKREVVDFH